MTFGIAAWWPVVPDKSQKTKNLPDDLSGRAATLVECLFMNDLPTLRRLTDPSDREEARAWLDEAQESLAGVKHASELDLRVLTEDKIGGIASVAVVKSKTGYGLVLQWRRQPDGSWLFHPGDEPAALRSIPK